MEPVCREWAGQEREFALLTGDVFDLEEATGERIGAIFARVSTGQFSLKEVYHTVRLALIRGGETNIKVKSLMATHFDNRPYMEHASLAGEILCALMVGVEEVDNEDEPVEVSRYKFSEVVQICTVFHMSPHDLRALRYADFVNLVRGFNAASETQKLEHLTEDEFIDILKRYEPEAVT